MIRNHLVSALLSITILNVPLHAQFDNLVTTDKGDTFLFQSPWRIVGSGDGSLQKILRWDLQGFSTVFSPRNSNVISPAAGANPVISGDGTISGYVSFPGCSGTACNTTPYTLVLSGATLPSSLPPAATFQISRNGRYLAAGTTVVDRNTGALQTVGSADPTMSAAVPIGGRFGIGNNGGLLALILHQVFLLSTVDLVLSNRPTLKIVNAPVVFGAIVSATENRVVYEIASNTSLSDRQLWSFDFATGQATLLEDFDFGTYVHISQYQPAISNDGMRLMYRRMNASTRAWEGVLRDFAVGSTIVVENLLPSLNNFTITGDGKSAWLHRTDGRLVRIALDGLAATEIPGRHAWISQREGAPVYGSYNHLFGGGFAPGNGSVLPPDLSVDLSGLTVPILTATSQQMGVQIPWETAPGNFTLTLHNSMSPFESVQPIDSVGLAPTFERIGLPGDTFRPAAVAHQDFRGLVTAKDPAVIGEIVHLYMTGLGDVQPRPQTGQVPAFLANASQLPQCWLRSPSSTTLTSAPVFFAGIAPGMVGIYQVDVAIPTSYSSPLATIGCFDQDGAQGMSGDFETVYVGSSGSPNNRNRPPRS